MLRFEAPHRGGASHKRALDCGEKNVRVPCGWRWRSGTRAHSLQEAILCNMSRAGNEVAPDRWKVHCRQQTTFPGHSHVHFLQLNSCSHQACHVAEKRRTTKARTKNQENREKQKNLCVRLLQVQQRQVNVLRECLRDTLIKQELASERQASQATEWSHYETLPA